MTTRCQLGLVEVNLQKDQILLDVFVLTTLHVTVTLNRVWIFGGEPDFWGIGWPCQRLGDNSSRHVSQTRIQGWHDPTNGACDGCRTLLRTRFRSTFSGSLLWNTLKPLQHQRQLSISTYARWALTHYHLFNTIFTTSPSQSNTVYDVFNTKSPRLRWVLHHAFELFLWDQAVSRHIHLMKDPFQLPQIFFLCGLGQPGKRWLWEEKTSPRRSNETLDFVRFCYYVF